MTEENKIKTQVQENGLFKSHFINNSNNFSLCDCLCEKIDNSYSAGANKFYIDKRGNEIFLIDDCGMTEQQLKYYANLYRSPNKKYEGPKIDIGVHGTGGKNADFFYQINLFVMY